MGLNKQVIGNCILYNAKMEHTIHQIHGVNHILTDPPYLYIKTHDFDQKFNEKRFFEGAKEMLPDNGFIALFGRGTSFYRWNTMLANLGFVFKEEIVWDKRFATSPAMSMSRVHETVSLHTKKKGKVRKTRVPYIEQKGHDITGIINDIKRIKSAINTDAGLNKILDFLKTGNWEIGQGWKGHNVANSSGLGNKDPASGTLRFIKDGMREKTIMPIFPVHYGSIHPTEKPVRLAERILALISDPGDTIYDPFMGSGSFGVACINIGRKYIGSEMKPEYFDIACKRIKQAVSENGLWQI